MVGPNRREAQVVTKSSKRYTTRSLLACVVLGVLGAVFVFIARFIGLMLDASAGWISYPPPVPVVIGALIAPILIRKGGAATLTGLVTAILGFGTMALVGALFIEAFYFAGRKLLVVESSQSLVNKKVLLWGLGAGVVAGIGMSTGVLMVRAVLDALPLELVLLGTLIKIIIHLVYGVLAVVIAKALFNAGINPQGLGMESYLSDETVTKQS